MSYGSAFAIKFDPATFHELDLVTLAAPVRTDEGETVPEGALGTIVAIWAEGSAFEVEFSGAVEGLATVHPAQIASYQRYTP